MGRKEFKHKNDPEYVGPELYCPFCQRYSAKFLPAGLDIPVLKEKNVVGAGYRLNATCPCCHSMDRERLVYLYLRNKSGLFDKNLKVLHVAPEKNLQRVLMAQPNIDYISADIDSPLAMLKMDITDIKYKDSSFDVVICNHVLEHIQDDRKAMAELYRVLKPGCWAILQVPISLSLGKTYEDPMITKPEERERVFGQSDHVRIYAKDYKDRLEKIGFSVEVYSFAKEFGDSAVSKYALLKDENIYICSKPGLAESTDAAAQQIPSLEGSREEKRSNEQIIGNNEWAEYAYEPRHETHVPRFNLLAHLIEGQKVLEIGCGNGDLSIEVARNGFDVVGIDMSEADIKQAGEKARYQNLDSQAKFSVMDPANLDFPDNSLDSVLITKVLGHAGNWRVSLEEAIRVVRNGGRIIVSLPDGLRVPFEGQLRVFSKDTLLAELGQYAEEITWHELPFKKWLICSFFVKKRKLDITDGPSVDIMMPTYNGRKYIRKAIKSVLSQTYQSWNLVVINDGGEDVKDIIDEFQDCRIKYITAEHKGKAHALNVGIDNSSGELIAYLDDDDVVYPLHLEVLVRAALEEKRNFVYSDWYEVSIDEKGREIGREFEYRLDVALWMLIRQNCINHKCILHKRSLLEKAGMYDEELDVLIDWDMIRRLAFVCPPRHVWSVTSERLRYYSKAALENRITSLWNRNPDKARRSMKRITDKTMDLPATAEELKKACIDAMLHRSYYHDLELNNMLPARDAQVRQIEQGIVTHFLKQYQSVAGKLLPPGTRRSYYYELGLRGIRIVLNEGWRSFWSRFRQWRKKSQKAKIPPAAQPKQAP
jgi:ubiquinone/menaquinone biosynthesis C-methylase UbiE/glycosyltransferase involved in cell wall biosynthesis